jgi:hypothetical protein
MRRALLVPLLLLLPAAVSLGADEIVLENGDRLSGEVIEKSGGGHGVQFVETEHADVTGTSRTPIRSGCGRRRACACRSSSG